VSVGTKVLLITLPILIILFLSAILSKVLYKKRKQIKFNKVFDVINKALNTKIMNMYYKNNDYYDLFIETQYSKYFIKIILEGKNKVLKIDSNYNYYFIDRKNNAKNINDMVKISSNEFNYIDVNKRVNKIIILYPDVLQKLFYKSQVEARFIYLDFEIQGTHILNFSEVKNFFDNSEL